MIFEMRFEVRSDSAVDYISEGKVTIFCKQRKVGGGNFRMFQNFTTIMNLS